MSVELIGAKMVAPYYGVSLYVWTAVLTVTLFSLASGYFCGGIISQKFPYPKTLYAVIALASASIYLMSWWSDFILSFTVKLGLKTGILISCFILLTFPLVSFGMVGPIAVRVLSIDAKKIGRTSGAVYFTSTIGGIFGAFVVGFYTVPSWGLKWSAITVASIVLLCSVIFFLKEKKSV